MLVNEEGFNKHKSFKQIVTTFYNEEIEGIEE